MINIAFSHNFLANLSTNCSMQVIVIAFWPVRINIFISVTSGSIGMKLYKKHRLNVLVEDNVAEV